MITILLLLAVLALVVTVVSGAGRAPLWVAVLLLCICELLRSLPVGR